MSALAINYVLDGAGHDADISPSITLAALLAQPVGCGEGVCGSCTVLVDGVALRSCLMLAAQVDGCSIETITSLAAIEGAAVGDLTPLQRAFTLYGAFQCGWCVPGMLVGTAAFLRDHRVPDRAALEAHFAGHLCRCLGGSQVIDATLAAVAEAVP